MIVPFRVKKFLIENGFRLQNYCFFLTYANIFTIFCFFLLTFSKRSERSFYYLLPFVTIICPFFAFWLVMSRKSCTFALRIRL